MVIFHSCHSFLYVHQRVNHVFICGWIWFWIKAPEQGPFGEGLFGPEPRARRDATAVRMAQWRRPVRPTVGVLVSGRYLAEIYHMWINCVISMSCLSVLRFIKLIWRIMFGNHGRDWSRCYTSFWWFSGWKFLKIMTTGSSCFHLTKILGPLGSPWVYPLGYWPRSCYFTPETQTARGPKLPLETVHPGIPATIATGRSGRLVQNNCRDIPMGILRTFPSFSSILLLFYSWINHL